VVKVAYSAISHHAGLMQVVKRNHHCYFYSRTAAIAAYIVAKCSLRVGDPKKYRPKPLLNFQ